MPLCRLNAKLFSVALVVFQYALSSSPQGAQEKADLAKLAAQIKDKDAAVRRSAAEALGQVGSAKGVEPLARMLQSQRLRDRRSAIIALGTIGGDKGCEALIPLLKSASAEDRDSAVAAIGGARCSI